jgi:DNA-binding NtrC family response regulator
MKILVTDRSINVRKLLARELAAEGHVVFQAINIIDAESIIDHNPDLDAIIFDPDLCSETWINLIQKIKNKKKKLKMIVHEFEEDETIMSAITDALFIQKRGKSVELIKSALYA